MPTDLMTPEKWAGMTPFSRGEYLFRALECSDDAVPRPLDLVASGDGMIRVLAELERRGFGVFIQQMDRWRVTVDDNKVFGTTEHWYVEAWADTASSLPSAVALAAVMAVERQNTNRKDA
jgi:hypothetical protein